VKVPKVGEDELVRVLRSRLLAIAEIRQTRVVGTAAQLSGRSQKRRRFVALGDRAFCDRIPRKRAIASI